MGFSNNILQSSNTLCGHKLENYDAMSVGFLLAIFCHRNTGSDNCMSAL